MNDLPIHLVVAAAQRTAAAAGAGFYIRRRGEAGRGTLLVIVNDQAGTDRIYRQVWDGERRALAEIDEPEIEAMVAREIEFDPDLWVIEIEDRERRLFFDDIFLIGDTI